MGELLNSTVYVYLGIAVIILYQQLILIIFFKNSGYNLVASDCWLRFFTEGSLFLKVF